MSHAWYYCKWIWNNSWEILVSASSFQLETTQKSRVLSMLASSATPVLIWSQIPELLSSSKEECSLRHWGLCKTSQGYHLQIDTHTNDIQKDYNKIWIVVLILAMPCSTCHEDMLAFRYFLIANASTAFLMDPHGYVARFSVELLEEFESLRPSAQHIYFFFISLPFFLYQKQSQLAIANNQIDIFQMDSREPYIKMDRKLALAGVHCLLFTFSRYGTSIVLAASLHSCRYLPLSFLLKPAKSISSVLLSIMLFWLLIASTERDIYFYFYFS